MADGKGAQKSGEVESAEVRDAVQDARSRTVEKATALSPRLIHEVIRYDGEEELERPFSSLFWSGIAAGVLISFSIIGKAMFMAYVPDAGWQPLIVNFGYSFGFLLVILGRMQLFTENTIVTVLPVMARRTLDSFFQLLRLWSIVLLANLLGCLIAACAMRYANILPPDIAAAVVALSQKAMGLPALDSLARGIPAGILIAALVWMLPQASSASFWVILLFTWLIGVCGFTHVVAGSVEMAYLLVGGDIAASAALGGFFLPVLAGNVIGGSLIFTFLAWAQVTDEIIDDSEG
ncbi:MAG: formate/nitrite transporter family protein [Halieaceae bacterium]|nr:formate/nitrite transporter family protein [Halieaceae bacterium]